MTTRNLHIHWGDRSRRNCSSVAHCISSINVIDNQLKSPSDLRVVNGIWLTYPKSLKKWSESELTQNFCPPLYLPFAGPTEFLNHRDAIVVFNTPISTRFGCLLFSFFFYFVKKCQSVGSLLGLQKNITEEALSKVRTQLNLIIAPNQHMHWLQHLSCYGKISEVKVLQSTFTGYFQQVPANSICEDYAFVQFESEKACSSISLKRFYPIAIPGCSSRPWNISTPAFAGKKSVSQNIASVPSD